MHRDFKTCAGSLPAAAVHGVYKTVTLYDGTCRACIIHQVRAWAAGDPTQPITVPLAWLVGLVAEIDDQRKNYTDDVRYIEREAGAEIRDLHARLDTLEEERLWH